MQRITIPLESRPGELAAITQLLADGGVDIRGVDAEEDRKNGTAVVQLMVDRYDEALTILRDGGYDPITEDTLLVRVKDEPGSLARVAARFSEVGVNVRSLHILRRESGESLVSLVTDDNEAAHELVRDVIVG